MSDYNENLQWRYATKKFDTTKKISKQQLDELLDSLQASASSYGLQPYVFFVITNPELRERMKAHAWNQSQVTDASHLIVVCARKTIDEAYVDSYISLIASTRGISVESLKGYRDMMVGSIHGRTKEELAHWMKCQSYIALGFLLSAAAQAKIDACPMEGFDPIQVGIDLELAEKNLTAVTFCALGFRAADDKTAAYKKVRFPKEDLFIFKD